MEVHREVWLLPVMGSVWRKTWDGIDYFCSRSGLKSNSPNRLNHYRRRRLWCTNLGWQSAISVALAAIKNNIPVYAAAGKIEESARKQLSKYFDRLILHYRLKGFSKRSLKGYKINLKSTAEKLRSLYMGLLMTKTNGPFIIIQFINAYFLPFQVAEGAASL